VARIHWDDGICSRWFSVDIVRDAVLVLDQHEV
jgi:hypothetical protein